LRTSSREVVVQRFRLEVVSGPDRGAACASRDGELAIGTAPGNQLILTDPAVSRHHCTVIATAGGFLLRDGGSTNGTRLAGCRIAAAHLEPGTTLALGETVIRFVVDGGEVSLPLSSARELAGAVGESAAMRRVFAVLERAAPTEATVLLEGETGVGKGVLAEAVHRLSARAAAPFVVVDCAALPGTLLESELFGHVRGSFTGADTDRVGLLASADQGTVFLDEIGELPLDLQPKLLRALERRAVFPVGSSTPLELDVRLIAATNRDLRRAVNDGSFRADLFYRLNTVRVEVPPLRERLEDIPALVSRFYAEMAPGEAPPAELITSALEHRWPGNVRELRAFVERAVLFGGSASPVSDGDPAEDDLDFTVSFREAKREATAAWERRYVKALIGRYQGNLSRAARAVEMDRNHLRTLLRRHGVED
jgi:transcriptional regulator with GAF, ATPase, and Fis domain